MLLIQRNGTTPLIVTVTELTTIANPTYLFEFIHEHLGQLHKIREYCNEQMKQVSITYHCSVHEKDEMFQDVPAKYNMNGEKKK